MFQIADILKKSNMVLTIIWIAMLMAKVIYAGVILFFLSQISGSQQPDLIGAANTGFDLTSIFAGISVPIAAASLQMRKYIFNGKFMHSDIFSPENITVDKKAIMRQFANMSPGIKEEDISALKKEDLIALKAIPKAISLYVITWAVNDAIAVLGLANSIMNPEVAKNGFYFIAAAMLLTFYTKPNLSRIKQHARYKSMGLSDMNLTDMDMEGMN